MITSTSVGSTIGTSIRRAKMAKRGGRKRGGRRSMSAGVKTAKSSRGGRKRR